MRGGTCVARKITRALACIKLGLRNELHICNLDSVGIVAAPALDYLDMQ